MGKVVVLGAGFSRGISSQMPLMGDLRRSLEGELGLPETTFAPWGGDVEAWLAHVSIAQPWLSDVDNARNRALFLEATEALYKIIISAQNLAEHEQPTWLDRLAWQWSHEHTVVITFNYDTLLELALARVGWTRQVEHFYAAPLSERRAVGNHPFLSASPPSRPIPRVLKLHGSVNWWHGGADAPATEQLVYVANPSIETRFDPTFSDLRPFLVPPTSAKNVYYGRSGLTTQWRAAAQALRAASSVDVIGYSFPVTDISTRSLLSSLIPDDALIRVVDPRAATETEAALAMTMPARSVGVLKQAVDAFANETAGRRVSGWYAYLGDGQTYGLHVECNGELTVEQLSESYPERDLAELLQERFGPTEYVQLGSRGPANARLSTVELFYPV